MKYYKILDKSECHYNLKYNTGLNIDPTPFNPLELFRYDKGISFTDVKNILAFLDNNFFNGYWIREVTLLENEEIYKGISLFGYLEYKAHQVILGERREINLDIIKELVNEGADVHIYNDCCLRYAAENGHLDIVKYCVEECGCDIHIDNELCLRYAAENGHLDIVKYCIEKCGCDIHFWDECCLRLAAVNGNLDIVKYCIEECDCDIHIYDECYLRWAIEYGYLDIFKYIINKGLDIKNKKDIGYVLDIIEYWYYDNNFYNEAIKYIKELEN